MIHHWDIWNSLFFKTDHLFVKLKYTVDHNTCTFAFYVYLFKLINAVNNILHHVFWN